VLGITALVVFAGLAAVAAVTFATTRRSLAAAPAAAPEPASTPEDGEAVPGVAVAHRGVQCLAHQRAGGQRGWGLQLYGGSHRHHCLAADATVDGASGWRGGHG
jgi:hypothetical protein